MKRIGLVLVISAAVLGTASSASAQSASPSLGCIPTSDTPFRAGISGPFPNPDYRVVLYQFVPGAFFQIVARTDNVSSDGFTTFAGVAPGFYDVGFLARGSITPLGTLQIGGCLPTSKEQCMKDGWRGFDFKNQGECVSFVSRGARP